jgi:ligand-binding sensor domain-containing protein
MDQRGSQPHAQFGIRLVPLCGARCLPSGAGRRLQYLYVGIVRWDGSEIVRAGAAASLNRVQALAMARDRDGNIWVGTDSRGLVRVNSQGAVPLDEGRNGSGDAVTAVFEDREGNLWSGSANGIERLRDSVFVTYSTAEGLPSKSNGPVYVDAQNRTWFAPSGGGLYWLSMGKIAGTGEDLWVGRQRGG